MEQSSSNSRLLTGLFFRLLPYQVLLIVINAVNGIVDSLYASNAIGKAAMSAIGLYGPFNHLLYAASIMLVSGSQILYGRYVVRERERIHSLFSVDLMISAVLSVLTAVLLALGAVTGLTRFMVSEGPVLEMFNRYILGQAVGIPALVLGQQLFAFLSLENRTGRTMTASVVCFAANAVLNHLFVVILPMGTFGLGLSSSIAAWIFLAVQAEYYLSGKSEWKFSVRKCLPGDGKQIARLGYPGALSRFVEMFRCFIVNFLILKYVGSAGLSAFAASNSLLAVVWAVPFGMVAVARMLFSISIGEEDRRSLVDTMRIVLTKGMLLMGVIVALLVLSAEPLTKLFYRDPSDPVYHMTVMGFRLLPLCMPLAVLSLTFAAYAQTILRKKLSVVLPVVDGMAGVTLFSFLLIPVLGMNGLYIANILNGFACFSVIFIAARICLGRVPRNLEDLMAVPEGFGVGKNERLDISVRNMEQVMHVSQQVIDFCGSRGIDPRRAYFSGLCMEEMAGNVVTHGFTKDDRQHSADIRVVHGAEGIILRIRDNCLAFDPLERMKLNEPGSEGKNVGIRLVYGIAGEVSYQNLLGLNVLTIRI